LSIKKLFLFVPTLFFLNHSFAADCSISYVQDTDISADCDGFTLIADQAYDLTINSGVTLADDIEGYPIDFALFNMTGTLTNNGAVSTSQTGGIGLVRGTVSSIINNGTLTADDYTLDLQAGATLTRFENTGGMTSAIGQTISVDGSTITTLINSGSITDATSNAISIISGTITTFNNSGTITSSGETISNIAGTITTLINTNTISSNGGNAIKNQLEGTIDTINNSGTILSETHESIYNRGGTIITLTNTGTIQSDNAEAIYNADTINTLTNTGTLKTTNIIYTDIINFGSIGTLVNGQGGDDALTYSGVLPNAYYIVINSSSDYGKVIFSDTASRMTFSVHSSSTLAENTTYEDVIDGLQVDDISETSGTYTTSDGDSYDWSLSNTSANLWSLLIGDCSGTCGVTPVSYPSTASTQTTINNISYGMSAQLAHFAMTTNFANLNTYDCGLFDAKGGCFSVGGRFTDVNANNNSDSDSSAIVMVGGYKINDHVRIAGFADQMVNNNTPSGIDMENKSPMVGLSLVWNQHPDHLGYQVKLANAYQDKDITITRTATGDAEAGSGSTDVSVQSYIAEVSYQFLSNDKTAYRPYFAGRYAKIKQDGYTETNVDNPLTYSTVEDESVTLIMGMKVKHALSPEIYLNGSLGVEHDVHNDVDNLSVTATNISGLSPVSVNSNINKTRGVASLGADYYLAKNQMLSLKTQFQELAYTHTNAKAAYLSYTIGF
jgi:hypothetical protein